METGGLHQYGVISTSSSTKRNDVRMEDLDMIFANVSDFEELRGKKILISGGSGFFGCWLLESLLYANDQLGLDVEITVVARDYGKFLKKAPHLALHSRVEFLASDVQTFEFPEGDYSHVIHCAADSMIPLSPYNAEDVLETIIVGTQRVIQFAREKGVKKMLLASSGSIYGPQPTGLIGFDEGYCGGPSPIEFNTSYAEGKRVAEMLWARAAVVHGIQAKIARGFAFVGPYLCLDAHFAIGNFIRDALNDQAILVKGDGAPIRSYMYAADLTVWLWRILFQGESARPYNVGSEQSVTVAELASLVRDCVNPRLPITVECQTFNERPASRYVPSTLRARTELQLAEHFSLIQSIERTVRYHRALNASKNPFEVIHVAS